MIKKKKERKKKIENLKKTKSKMIQKKGLILFLTFLRIDVGGESIFENESDLINNINNCRQNDSCRRATQDCMGKEDHGRSSILSNIMKKICIKKKKKKKIFYHW